MTDTEHAGLQVKGYFPGVIGMVTELHAVYYYEHWDFDISFETQVATELSEFLLAFQRTRDGFWAATMKGVFSGSIAIDGKDFGNTGVRLRWFIADPRHHRKGIGSALMKRAIDFCREQGHHQVYLWTFQGLDAARSIYERVGFRLSEEHDVYQWGRNIREQKFELNLVTSQ